MNYAMKCEVCGCGPQQDVSIYRTGGKGPGINPHWRCLQHKEQPMPEVETLVAVIESHDRGQA
jgi:hypothetical protein